MAGELIEVLTVPSTLEGEIVRSRLQDEGVPVLLKGGGSDPYRIGPVHVYVPAEFEVQARLILDAIPVESDGPGDASEPEVGG